MKKENRELLKLYVESVKRSRTIFLFLAVATLLLFSVLFNLRYSWAKYYNEIVTDQLKKQNAALTDSTAVIQIAKTLKYNPIAKGLEAIEIEHQSFKVPILDIHLYAQDVSIFGGLALALLLTWLLYSRLRDRSICTEIIEFSMKGYWKEDNFGNLTVNSDGDPELLNICRNKEAKSKIIKSNFLETYEIIRFSTIFNKIKHIEKKIEDNNNKIEKIIFFIAKKSIRFMYFIPIILFVWLWSYDVRENYFKGPSNQQFLALELKYIELIKRQHEPIFITKDVQKIKTCLRESSQQIIPGAYISVKDSVFHSFLTDNNIKTDTQIDTNNVKVLAYRENSPTLHYMYNYFHFNAEKKENATLDAFIFIAKDVICLILLLIITGLSYSVYRVARFEDRYRKRLEYTYYSYFIPLYWLLGTWQYQREDKIETLKIKDDFSCIWSTDESQEEQSYLVVRTGYERRQREYKKYHLYIGDEFYEIVNSGFNAFELKNSQTGVSIKLMRSV